MKFDKHEPGCSITIVGNDLGVCVCAYVYIHTYMYMYMYMYVLVGHCLATNLKVFIGTLPATRVERGHDQCTPIKQNFIMRSVA